MNKRIKFINCGVENPLNQVYKERVIDWLEDGDVLLQQTRLYKEEYRNKICSSCSIEQQTKRKCIKYVIDGKELTNCNHMNVACGKKFKKKMDKHMNFHPSMSGRK